MLADLINFVLTRAQGLRTSLFLYFCNKDNKVIEAGIITLLVQQKRQLCITEVRRKSFVYSLTLMDCSQVCVCVRVCVL